MTQTHPIRAALRAAMARAMKERDREALAACRTALAAIDNAEAAPVETLPPAGAVEGSAIGVGAADRARRELSDEEMRAVVQGEIDERRAAIETLRAEHADRARVLEGEALVLEGLLRKS
ncbi:MAG: hypothetical protein LWW86_13790 [Micrococcales bacterium]|nr:hypothetical protein [Micrococcales bacterium]